MGGKDRARRLSIPTLNSAQEASFWARVDKSDGCWAWTGASDGRTGRGKFWPGKTGFSAPRVAWAMANGSDPGPFEVCHSCDNPNCVNPDHLWLGTHADNMRDASLKKRFTGPRKTHCKHGHPFERDNIYIRPGDGQRACLACIRIRGRGDRPGERP